VLFSRGILYKIKIINDIKNFREKAAPLCLNITAETGKTQLQKKTFLLDPGPDLTFRSISVDRFRIN